MEWNWKRLSSKRYTIEANLYLTLIKAKDGDWELYTQCYRHSPRVLDFKLTGSKDQPIEEVIREAETLYIAKCQHSIIGSVR